MMSTRIPAALLLTVATFLTGACGAQDDTSGTASAPSASEPEAELIEYTDNPSESVGVTVSKAGDVTQLEGAPDDFKQFIAGAVTGATAMFEDKDCPFSVGVDRIDTSGFALGSMASCGGAAFIWAKRDGVWQQIWGGQDIPACEDLSKYSVPKSFWNDSCWDGEKDVEYTG
jgi:hypothetical protein